MPAAGMRRNSSGQQLTPQGFSQADVVHTGQLLKLGAVNKTWKERWFVLVSPRQGDKDRAAQHQAQLYYYRTHDARQPQGVVNIATSVIRESQEYSPNVFAFEIVTHTRIYQLVCPSHTEMVKWISVLTACSHIAVDNRQFDELEEAIRQAEWLCSAPRCEALLRPPTPTFPGAAPAAEPAAAAGAAPREPEAAEAAAAAADGLQGAAAALGVEGVTAGDSDSSPSQQEVSA
eukprot:TRINITY_DN72506_c0_g1_i1.p1 TRINITY_DN72506_c0_g1~~TRINITY_DN72506_c0_g1_i1.p1  ORF type:complete len:232 (+),score=44.60 TRINITY_DN72506_c0_g1_i1:95-790(+)